MLRLRDRLLPLVNLAGLLRLGSRAGAVHGAYIVVAQVGAEVLGIIVDRVFDTEEIVVKPVAPILRHVTMFSGNTILGDGSVIMILDPNGIARATGIGSAVGQGCGRGAERAGVGRTHGDAAVPGRRRPEPLAVPLGLVARLEEIAREQDRASPRCAGHAIPRQADAACLDRRCAGDEPRQPVLVFTDGDRSMGLMVDEIVDVVEERLHIELTATRPGLLGTAVIAGQATDVIDTEYWLARASRFLTAPAAA